MATSSSSSKRVVSSSSAVGFSGGKTTTTTTTTTKSMEELLEQGMPQIRKFYSELFDDNNNSNEESTTTTAPDPEEGGGNHTCTPSNKIEDRVSNDDFYPKFNRDEVQLGKVLGKGGFAIVYEIKAFQLVSSSNGTTAASSSRALNNGSNQLGYEDDDDDDDEEKQVDDQYEQLCMEAEEGADKNTQRFQKVSRTFLSQHCFRAPTSTKKKKKKKAKRTSSFSKMKAISTTKGDARYACKVLATTMQPQQQQQSSSSSSHPSSTGPTSSTTNSKEWAQKFLQGILDIAIEARFLSSLQHRNIVKCKGMAKGQLFRHDYFLVLDRLYHTLEYRIYKVWATKPKIYSSIVGKIMPGGKNKRSKLWEERLVYAWDLSSAITYLHSRKILYRDLKPENIGFDCRDDIKLFDFGLSRPLKEHLKVITKTGDNDTVNLYKLTPHTGSPRYMAPEVAWGQPYNETCDTYSFCIILWEMMTTQRPFELYNMSKMKQRVWGPEAKRPFLHDEIFGESLPLKLLLQKGWTANLQERFRMEQVEEILGNECVRITEDAGNGGEDGAGGGKMIFQRRESDTSLIFQQQRRGSGRSKTNHELYQDYTESNLLIGGDEEVENGEEKELEEEEQENAMSNSMEEQQQEENGISESLCVGDERSNLPHTQDEEDEDGDDDWWLPGGGRGNDLLEKIVRDALGELS